LGNVVGFGVAKIGRLTVENRLVYLLLYTAPGTDKITGPAVVNEQVLFSCFAFQLAFNNLISVCLDTFKDLRNEDKNMSCFVSHCI
jgi:hypothetical protein